MHVPRRALLGGMAASALVMPNVALAHPKRPRIGIIGGGIIGASIAAQLSQAGAEVILFEKERPAAGATQASVGWINPVIEDEHYVRLRLASMDAWLEDDRHWGLGALWGGSISWADGDKKAETLRSKGDLLKGSRNEPQYLTAAQIKKMSPNIIPGDAMRAAFYLPRDGHVDPVVATNRYLEAAKKNGATIIHPCEVTEILLEGTRLKGVRTTKGDFNLDQLVTAAGTDTPKMMSLVGKRLELMHAPGLVIHTTPQPVETKMVYAASGVMEFKQYADGRFLASYTAGPPNLPQHAEILKKQIPYPDEYLAEHHARMLIGKVAVHMPGIGKADPARILLGFRPKPLDNRPIIGPVPGIDGVYVVVTHSGVTLAPILGRYTAQELMRGTMPPLLAPYRPERYIKAA